MRDGLLERPACESPLATQAIDLAELLERVRNHARAEPLVEVLRRLEVGHRLVQASEPRERLTAVRERECPERREAGDIGEPQREIELGDRLLVGALLHVPRAAVRPHPDQLEHVTGLLRIVEGPQVVRVVRATISLERGKHREDGVGCR